MSSKAKQVLLWLVIISGALSFVWFLQSRATKPAQDLSIDMALTRIQNKEFKEALFKQNSVELTDQSGNKFVTKIGTDPVRDDVRRVQLHPQVAGDAGLGVEGGLAEPVVGA